MNALLNLSPGTPAFTLNNAAKRDHETSWHAAQAQMKSKMLKQQARRFAATDPDTGKLLEDLAQIAADLSARLFDLATQTAAPTKMAATSPAPRPTAAPARPPATALSLSAIYGQRTPEAAALAAKAAPITAPGQLPDPDAIYAQRNGAFAQ